MSSIGRRSWEIITKEKTPPYGATTPFNVGLKSMVLFRTTPANSLEIVITANLCSFYEKVNGSENRLSKTVAPDSFCGVFDPLSAVINTSLSSRWLLVTGHVGLFDGTAQADPRERGLGRGGHSTHITHRILKKLDMDVTLYA